MKRNRESVFLKTFAMILFSAVTATTAQESNDLRLIDEFDPRAYCEALERRLDVLFSEATQSNSNAIVVIAHGDRVVDTAVVHRRAVSYATFRGFPADRYQVLLTKRKGDIRVELWLGKNGKMPPITSTGLSLALPLEKRRVLFADDEIQLVTIDGHDTFIGTGNPSCSYWDDLKTIWDFLNANSAFDVEFRITTRSRRIFIHAVTILRRDFVENGAPMKRIKFVERRRGAASEGTGGTYAGVVVSFVQRTRK